MRDIHTGDVPIFDTQTEPRLPFFTLASSYCSDYTCTNSGLFALYTEKCERSVEDLLYAY
ncbi:MAG: hypothetical protein BMS9Abin05_2031 [Rhodothermia bacterium]|nr:MAG: hypothetical protein BMS9Abin05_2031 [Rhodothermia bacterium]